MQKLSVQILKECLWLAFSVALTVLLAVFLFGKSSLTGNLDIHLHDTYFVISKWYLLAPLFLIINFIVYFIRVRRSGFIQVSSNWIFLFSGFSLIIALTILAKLIPQFFIGGITLYPPLSALGPDKVPEMMENSVLGFIANIIVVFQSLILIVIVFSVYRWGTQNRRNNAQ